MMTVTTIQGRPAVLIETAGHATFLVFATEDQARKFASARPIFRDVKAFAEHVRTRQRSQAQKRGGVGV